MAYIKLYNIDYEIKNKKQLFDGLNFEIEQHEFVSLIGDNGCGKTTLTKMIIGTIKPDKGEISLNHINIGSYKLYEVGQELGYLFQNPDLQLFNSTIEDELLFSSKYIKEFEEDADLRFKDIVIDLALEECLSTNIQNLSQGEKQRVAIGTILMNRPKFLILDEPTTGLDYKRKTELSDILIKIHNQGIGVLLISHDMSFVNQFPGKVAKLENGRIDYV